MTKDVQVSGRSYSANSAKLLKHLPKLQRLQQGKVPSPVMLHISPINACNLTCSFCCFANRDMSERLTYDQVATCVRSFAKLGITGVEFTGGGEPTLHPQINKMIEFCHSLGLKVGICTNGVKLDKVKVWNLVTWVRIGLYGFTENYTPNLALLEGTGVEVSAAYVYDESISTSLNPNVHGNWTDGTKKILSKSFQTRGHLLEAIIWAEKNRIPTRIAFNAIREASAVIADINEIKRILRDYDSQHGPRQYVFLSDFNYKPERRNNNCYMHLVKPCLFTDGNVYVCPSAELSPENKFNVNEQFKVCEWNTVEETYSQMATTGYRRDHDCSFCKYAMQNEILDDVLMETRHNEFA